MALKKLMDWMKLFSSEERFYRENNVVIYIYGEEDCSYAVLEKEISKSPRTIEQYTISPLKNQNGLFTLVCFLQECSFDLDALISKIVGSDYIEEGMTETCQVGHLEITRYLIENNQPP